MIKSINGEKFVRTPILFDNLELNYKKQAPELGDSNKLIKKKILCIYINVNCSRLKDLLYFKLCILVCTYLDIKNMINYFILGTAGWVGASEVSF